MYAVSFMIAAFVVIIQKGFHPACKLPSTQCTCETALYATVGSLALLAGLVQFIVGYFASMAVLSDSLHALADSGADFLGVFIAYKASAMQGKEKVVRSFGNKMIALFLVVGGVLIAYEALERWMNNEYVVSPVAAMLVGGFGYFIDHLRVTTLRKARQHYASASIDGFIDHAQSDKFHSGVIALGGVIASASMLLPFSPSSYEGSIKAFDLTANIVLTAYMLSLGYRRWHNKGCGHAHSKQKKQLHKHTHCDHNHHH